MDYYEVFDDLNKPKKRWFLGSINFDGEWDFWQYIKAQKVKIPTKELFIKIRRTGVPIDITFADFGLIIVTEKIRNLVNDTEAEFIPVKIEDLDLKLYLMVITNEMACVDEERSVFKKWLVNDPIRPDKAGQYKSFDEMVIDANVIPEQRSVFRLKSYNVVIIINQVLKDIFDSNKVTGVTYKKLT